MNMEWKTVKLGEVAIFRTGKLDSNAAVIGGKYPFFTCSPLTLAINDYAFDQEAILLAGNNAEGNFNIKYYKGRFNAYQRTYVINPKMDNLDIKYLYYALKIYLGKLKTMSQGTSTKFLTVKLLNNFNIPLPSLNTQHRIAAILSSLDDKIENNNRINRNLEAQAQALFKSWFVDFEPWGGTMPEDWKKGTLGEIAHVTSGKRPPLKQSLCSADINIPLIGAADIMGYTNSVLYTTPILVTGRVGTHGIVQRFNEPCWPSDNTLVVEGKWYEYIYQTMCRIDYHNMNRGSTQPLITQTDLKNQKVIIPNVSILDKFETQVTILYKQVYINQRENQRLAKLRDTLLPKLMKGEIAL